MKVTEEIDVFAVGEFHKSAEWAKACQDVREAVTSVDWPHGSGKFTIYPESGKARGAGNGVVPIKIPCVKYLRNLGWETETLPKIEPALETGDLDAFFHTPKGNIGFEWETGNISSSHRAINKLLLTLKVGGLKGCILVVPSDRLKRFLTDRIGNIGELRHYFRLWDDTRAEDGVLRIVVAEHDAESTSVPRIPKGKDGRALG